MRRIFAAGAVFAAIMVMITVMGSPVRASDPVCANPVTETEIAVCNDSHLLGLDLELATVINRMVDINGGELPETVQFDYANHMIEREECGSHYRCLEDSITRYLDQITGSYLDWADTPLAAYQDVAFDHYDAQDSPGNDLIPSKSAENFGWSQTLCRLRCASNDQCYAVGYDVMQQKDGVHGYCTMKSAITMPLKDWRESGVLMVKR